MIDLLSSVEAVECLVLNADLDAKRRCARGGLSRAQHEAMRPHFKAALASLRDLTDALAALRTLSSAASSAPEAKR